jgi:hypothetical protein
MGQTKPLGRRGRVWMLAALLLGAFIFPGPARAAEPAPLDAVLTALAPPPSAEALVRIPDPGRKLLALRSYLRSGAELPKRWSWTAEEIKAFEGSPEQKALLAEIDAVKAHFKAANPPTCSMRPLFITTTRSASSSASSWSWVTKTVVWPVSSWRPAQPAAQFLAHLGVERAERLVEQQHARLDGQRAGQRHALPLAARELRRVAVLPAPRAAPARAARSRARDLAFGGPAGAGARAGRRRCSRTPSCAGTARSAGTRSRRAAPARAAGRRPRRRRRRPLPSSALQPGDDPQQRRLAGAGRAEQRHQFAGADVERHVVQRRVAPNSCGCCGCDAMLTPQWPAAREFVAVAPFERIWRPA